MKNFEKYNWDWGSFVVGLCFGMWLIGSLVLIFK